MIYTSYFAKLSKFPRNIIPISISAKSPSWYEGLQFKYLAPSYKILMEYKSNKNCDYYIEHFYDEILNKLEPKKVVDSLYKLSNNQDIVLICYEKSTDFCHRHLVSEWLNKNGYSCKEYIF